MILLTVLTSVNSKVEDHKIENSELSVNVNDGSGDEYSGVVIHGNEKRDDDDVKKMMETTMVVLK